MVDSVLDRVPGVGPVRKRALLRRFGSLKRIREADREALEEVVPVAIAAAVHAALHGEGVDDRPTGRAADERRTS